MRLAGRHCFINLYEHSTSMEKRLSIGPKSCTSTECVLHVTDDDSTKMDTVHIYVFPVSERADVILKLHDQFGSSVVARYAVSRPCFAPVLVLNGLSLRPQSTLLVSTQDGGRATLFGYLTCTACCNERFIEGQVICQRHVLKHQLLTISPHVLIDPNLPVTFLLAVEAVDSIVKLENAEVVGTHKYIILKRGCKNASCRLRLNVANQTDVLGHRGDITLRCDGDFVSLLWAGDIWFILASSKSST